jgi:hypothetical protein
VSTSIVCTKASLNSIDSRLKPRHWFVVLLSSIIFLFKADVGHRVQRRKNHEASLKSLIVASALFQALSFLFVALLNVILPPYGGTWLAVLTSLYLGYHPEAGPVSFIIGTAYALISGAVAARFSVGFITTLSKGFNFIFNFSYPADGKKRAAGISIAAMLHRQFSFNSNNLISGPL